MLIKYDWKGCKLIKFEISVIFNNSYKCLKVKVEEYTCYTIFQYS